MVFHKWDYREIEYLTENYGKVSISTIAKNLKRSIYAVLNKKTKIKARSIFR